MIRFEDVTKVYADGTVAVDRLSLEAPDSSITVLVGPSGCGKTTTLRMINRLIEPTGGTISLDGVDTATLPVVQLRRGIGYVIQSAGLFPHRTVVENVAGLPRLLGTPRRQARAQAMELLERVGLEPALADRYPAQLSGGQQQRVGVARALATDPPVLLMDEPFSAVDPVVRAGLQEAFLRLQHDIGKTIVLVTHDIDEALRIGDRVAVFRQGGHLAQVAAPAELLARPRDPFVADFVGRSRGYQALGFVDAPAGLPVRPETAVRAGETLPATGADPWVVLVDEAGAPLGWLDARRADEVAQRDAVDLGGTWARADGTVRDLLNAALSSPNGRGLVVGPDGRLAGSVDAADVVAAAVASRAGGSSGVGAGSGPGAAAAIGRGTP